MKFFQIQKCCIKTTSSYDLSPFIEKMYLNFFAAILIWPIDHAYGDTTATSEDCGFVFVNGCTDSVQGGVYFDEIFADEKDGVIWPPNFEEFRFSRTFFKTSKVVNFR